MDNHSILATIDAEIARLQQARSIIAQHGTSPTRRTIKKVAQKRIAKTTGKRTLSPEARARIAEAQRRRWAASKKEAK